MGRKLRRYLLALSLCVALVLTALVFAGDTIRDSFGVYAFTDGYEYKWTNSDQPEVINYGSKLRKSLIKAAFVDSFLRLLTVSAKDSALAYLKHRGDGNAFEAKVEIGEQAIALGVSFGRGEPPGTTLKYLKDAGIKSVIVRVPDRFSKVYAHVDHENIKAGIFELLRNNIEVVISLPQSRDMVNAPERWALHVREVMRTYYPVCKTYIVGHVPNRVKWGVWDYREFLSLFEIAKQEIRKYKGAKIVGPSVIDFEWFWFAALLREIPASDLDVINTLLYVDRRGPPEGRQAGFDFPAKLRVMELLYKNHQALSDKPLWVTEVNWPLSGHGDWSPAATGFTEEEYANYLLRYYVLGLSSGRVDRIYWWRLVARGYGLLDNSSGTIRERPGWLAFKYMRENLSGSVFTGAAISKGDYIFKFQKNSQTFYIAWSTNEMQIAIPPGSLIYGRDGRVLEGAKSLNVGGRPVYIFTDKEVAAL